MPQIIRRVKIETPLFLLSVFLTQNVGNGPEAVAGEALQEPEHEEGDVVGGEGGEQPRHQAHHIAVIELQTKVREYFTITEKDPTRDY